MLVLPIYLDNEIIHLKVTFKAMQVKKDVLMADKINVPPSSVMIGRTVFNPSLDTMNSNYTGSSITSFIRKYMTTNRGLAPIYVTSKAYHHDFYHVYKLPNPPLTIHPIVDDLYGNMIEDLRLNVDSDEKAHKLSLRKLGIDQLCTHETLEKMKLIKKTAPTYPSFLYRLENEGFSSLVQLLEFINQLDISLIENGNIHCSSLNHMIERFSSLSMNEAIPLKKYQTLAFQNYESYSYLKEAYQIMYNKELETPNLQFKKIFKKSA